MKNLLFFLLLISTVAFSQENVLKFDKKLIECENKWVLLPKKEKDSTYGLGFFYIDRTAGFSIKLDKTLILKNGIINSIDSTQNSSISHRVSNGQYLVEIVSNKILEKFKIDKYPRFFEKSYLPDNFENDSNDLVKRGYWYNALGRSDIALPLLEKAKLINNKTENLNFELAFAYNVTKQFEKSISLLHIGIKNEKNNFLLYKELIYALVENNQIAKAEIAFSNGIKIKEKKYADESAYNIAYGYFKLKNKPKFEEWKKLVTSYSTKTDSAILKQLDLLSKELNK